MCDEFLGGKGAVAIASPHIQINENAILLKRPLHK